MIKNNEFVLQVYKLKGKFYYAYDDNGILLSYIMDYKLLDGNKCGFPESALNKVINRFEDNYISYKIIEVNKNVIFKDFKNKNKYKDLLKIAFNKLEERQRVDYLIEKIKKLDNNRLKMIIEFLEEKINE